MACSQCHHSVSAEHGAASVNHLRPPRPAPPGLPMLRAHFSRTSSGRRPSRCAAASSCGHRCSPKAGGSFPRASASRKMSTLRQDLDFGKWVRHKPEENAPSVNTPPGCGHSRAGSWLALLSTCSQVPRPACGCPPVEGETVNVNRGLWGRATLVWLLSPYCFGQRNTGPQQLALDGEPLPCRREVQPLVDCP